MTSEEPVVVLLVDDEPAFADLTAEHLSRRRESFDIRVEYSGQAGLDALDETIDCVVSDYEMPQMDGLAFLRAARSRWPALPFILFTGRGSEEIASDAISAGVTDYLQKQTGSDQYDLLANRIENAVARRRSERAATETESRYRTLLERHPNAVAVHDGEKAMYINERFVELVGAEDADSIADRAALSFVHPDDRATVAERIQAVLEGDTAQTDWIEWRLQRLDGETRHVESRGSTVEYRGRQASQVVVRDVTHRHERERRLEALTAATRRLFTAPDHERVAEIAVDVLDEILDEDLTAVWRYRDEQLQSLARSDRAASLADADVREQRAVLPEWSIEHQVFESGDAQVISDYGEREDAVVDVLATVFLVPLGDRGLLAAGSIEPRAFTEAERNLVTILAQSVTAAFDRLEDPH